ncbi:MAG TPA: hypothetical protein VJ987_13620, partial [Anaerolineales bacterium]|nr:hypothetical protein [Anaerolineales bacterium]
MKSEKSTTNLITNALLWAAAMIGSSLLLGNSEHSKDMLFLLLTLSTASFLILDENRKSIKSEWKCIQRRFGSK